MGTGRQGTADAVNGETGSGYLTWPNAVTLLRVPLAAAFVAAETMTVRGVILIAAAASDWLDGWLARRLGQASRAGELLDPIADKTFVVAALATFALDGSIRPWELFVLLLRDVYAVIAFLVATALRLSVRFRSRWSGKIVTGLQIAAVLGLMVRPGASLVLVVVVGVASLVAIADYTRAGLRNLRPGRRRE